MEWKMGQKRYSGGHERRNSFDYMKMEG